MDDTYAGDIGGLLQTPQWHLQVAHLWARIESLRETEPGTHSRLREELFDTIELALRTGRISLGRSGKDWDRERTDIDTIVIHHTSQEPGLTLARLSAMSLVRLYVPAYARNRQTPDPDIAGKEIWSNHVRNGRQVFYPYHWLIRSDGSRVRLLEDTEIGWHAGVWDINCRSVAICLDGDFEHSTPSETMLRGTADLIRKLYGHVPHQRIIGHCEARTDRTCPSQLFLADDSGAGWKSRLLSMLDTPKAGT